MKPTHLTRFVLIALSLATGSLSAATLNQTFMNDFEATSIYLWSDAPGNMSFVGAGFGADMSTWSVTSNTGAQLVLGGSTVAPGAGRFDLAMNYHTAPFTVQWAEVFFSGLVNVVRGSGTLTYQGAGWSNVDAFSHLADIPNRVIASSAVPLPSSVLLMLTSLLFVPLTKLRQRTAP